MPSTDTRKRLDIPKEVAKIWQEAKNNLRILSERTLSLAQKGEKELVRASRIGKLQLNIVSMNLKKENAFRELGKKTYAMHIENNQVETANLTALFSQINKLDQQIKAKKTQITKIKKEA
ncbi:MAG: hypothetical protein V1662_05380 [Candidatus Omnitrophota bacterium]